ncbi:MAG: hypothetical protein SGPRY_005936 [Prymnesium sp.]
MEDVDIFGDGGAEDDLGEEIARADTDEIAQRTRMIENEIKVLKNEAARLNHEKQSNAEKIKENTDKIKLNKQLPYLVANVVELIDMELEEEPEEDGANVDLDAHRKGKCCVLKTSTRQTIFLPVPGLVEPEKLKPADLVGVNKDSYLILEALPSEFDSRVKAMEVDEKPTEEFNDVGGLDGQIQELVTPLLTLSMRTIEAVVLPMTHRDRFESIGIKPPKGALMYGPPGTGKTLMARACAARTNACFLKLAGPQLVQMFIGDGEYMHGIRDSTWPRVCDDPPCCLAADSILNCQAIVRFSLTVDPETWSVWRTGFASSELIKVIAATNRIDILDPALLRSGKTALIPAACVEAGMLALRREATEIHHEDFIEGITAVQTKKKASLAYYA